MWIVAEVGRRLSNRTLACRLVNGHRLIGVLPKKLASISDAISVGERLTILVSPFDMSKGVVVGRT